MDTASDILLDLLRCPICRQTMEIAAPHAARTLQAPRYDSRNEEPILTCGCGATYPIVDGVPRLLANQDRPESVTTSGGQDDYDLIRQSFSKEWAVFDYETDKTWGWTLDERKSIFLQDVGLDASELKGKLVLDAGCGNGTLTAALTAFGLEIIGIDLSDRLGVANLQKSRYAGPRSNNVNYVQANLFNPPFEHGSFDLVYSSGVIHHTPDSRATFTRLVPLVKRHGRLYVWVYGKRSLPVRIFFESGRQLKRFMALDSVMTVCKVVTPFYAIGTRLLDGMRIMRFRRRTTREITLDLFDQWAPQYNHWHLENEVTKWFEESGFTNITISGRQKHGFGCYGDKA